MTDDLAALRLLVAWGADEALSDLPADHFAAGLAPVAARTAVPAASPRQLGAGLGGLNPAGPGSAPPGWAAVPPAGAAAAAEARRVAGEAGSLEALHLALDGFTGCPLRATAMHTVRPAGNAGAGLVLIAEAPGAEDDRTGQAFSGLPGRLLDQVLASIGLDRSGVLLTHLVPWRPPGSRAPNEAELQACLPFLHRLLALTRPSHLLLAGAGPTKALAGATDGLRRVRGRWLPIAIEGQDAAAQALAVPSIDLWLRSPAAKRSLWSDMIELRRKLGNTT